MYCPKCRAEFREGFTRCMKCDVDLVEEKPEPPPRPPSVLDHVHLPDLRKFRIEDWLKTGAYVYVVVGILAALLGRAGLIAQGLQVGNWGALFVNFCSSMVSVLIQGAMYYGVGTIIGMLREWVANDGE